MVRPSFWKKTGFVVFSGALLGAGAFLHAACENVKSHAAGQKPEDLQETLAKIDDVVISVGEFQDRINKQSPYVRARYTSLERKKEFLDNLVRFEVLAKEAQKRGLDKDAEVVRTMKQVMIQKLLKDEFDKVKAEDINDADAKKYYDAHPEEFNKPEEVRVSSILVKDESAAKKVLADARMKGVDNQGFRNLVAQYSTDQATKDRGGDLRYFDAGTKEIPQSIVTASFKLSAIGDNSPPVKTDQGWVVLKLTGRRKALVRTFEEVKQTIKNRIYRDRRQDSMEAFVKNLREKASIKIDEGKLAKVQIEGAGSGQFPGPGVPPPAPGQFHPGAGRDADRDAGFAGQPFGVAEHRASARKQLAVRCGVRSFVKLALHILGCCLLATPACPPRKKSAVIERVVAVINNEIVLESELELEQYALPLIRGNVDPESADGKKLLEEAKHKALDALIDERLVMQQANELKLSVTPEEVDRAIEEVKRQNKLDDATFSEALKGQGFTMEAYRKNLKRQILNLKVVNTAVRSRVTVGDDEVKTYYQQNARQLGGDKTAHLRQILVAVPADANPDEVERKKRVAGKVVELARGGTSFQELAKKYSDDETTRDDGGDAGWVGKGVLVETLEDAIAGMDPGDVRGPVRTARGWMVLQVVERKQGDIRLFDEVKEQPAQDHLRSAGREGDDRVAWASCASERTSTSSLVVVLGVERCRFTQVRVSRHAGLRRARGSLRESVALRVAARRCASLGFRAAVASSTSCERAQTVAATQLRDAAPRRLPERLCALGCGTPLLLSR